MLESTHAQKHPRTYIRRREPKRVCARNPRRYLKHTHTYTHTGKKSPEAGDEVINGACVARSAVDHSKAAHATENEKN